MGFTFIPDLMTEVQVPQNGILSRTMYNDDDVRVVLFAFAEGQELSAHTAPMSALIQIIQGEAQLTLDDESVEARAGALVRMPPNLRHAITARKPLIMLLTMLKKAV